MHAVPCRTVLTRAVQTLLADVCHLAWRSPQHWCVKKFNQMPHSISPESKHSIYPESAVLPNCRLPRCRRERAHVAPQGCRVTAAAVPVLSHVGPRIAPLHSPLLQPPLSLESSWGGRGGGSGVTVASGPAASYVLKPHPASSQAALNSGVAPAKSIEYLSTWFIIITVISSLCTKKLSHDLETGSAPGRLISAVVVIGLVKQTSCCTPLAARGCWRAGWLRY